MGELRDIVTGSGREIGSIVAEMAVRLALLVAVVGVCIAVGAGLGWLVGGSGPAVAGGLAGSAIGVVAFFVLDLTGRLPPWPRSRVTLGGGRRGRRT